MTSVSKSFLCLGSLYEHLMPDPLTYVCTSILPTLFYILGTSTFECISQGYLQIARLVDSNLCIAAYL